MTDENVHIIIDDVRRSVGGESGNDDEYKMGTVITLVENEMFRSLWQADFQVGHRDVHPGRSTDGYKDGGTDHGHRL